MLNCYAFEKLYLILNRVSLHYETVLVGRVRHFYADDFGGDERVRPLLVHHETGSIVLLYQHSFFRLSRSVVQRIPEIRKWVLFK